MESTQQEPFRELLIDLTGQKAPPLDAPEMPFPSTGLGYSQFNETLLRLGYDRVSTSYFQLLVDGSIEYQPLAEIRNLEEFAQGVKRAKTLALLFFGNVKFGFKTLAGDDSQLRYYFSLTQAVPLENYEQRHRPVFPIDQIDATDTYLLGYLVDREIKRALEVNADDEAALEKKQQVEEIRRRGLRNHHAYLVSDHLDVYVATSMRERHEYAEIAEITSQVFRHERLSSLNLRWFDPTLAYCPDRIDKGLSEALMLKRALCTLYLAQETDTLGKDSELASTLAQGKIVIAYVPSPTEEQLVASVRSMAELYGKSEAQTILDRLKALSPTLAWSDQIVRGWLDRPEEMNLDEGYRKLSEVARQHYDKRADTLSSDHPLGIQVNLATGVANGVLVVRNIPDCAELIRRVVTGTLEFVIEKKTVGGETYQLLIETVSESVFRVMTGDVMLTNSFWNFYPEPAQ